MRDAFGNFVDRVESVIRRLHEPKDMVLAIEPLIRCLMTEPDWLKAEFRRPIRSKAYAQYLLYRPADLAFSVVSFVWNPGQGSPIHDHCTRGVIGQYSGDEERSRFRITNNPLAPPSTSLPQGPGRVISWFAQDFCARISASLSNYKTSPKLFSSRGKEILWIFSRAPVKAIVLVAVCFAAPARHRTNRRVFSD